MTPCMIAADGSRAPKSDSNEIKGRVIGGW
jgi:hypothetical protein